jgi:single-strand DNA-binding protein
MADTTTTIVGNLTADPELRFTPGGAPVADFTVAVTPRVKDGAGWKDGDTSFFRCTAWRGLAEHLAKSLGKGDRVLVHGTLRQRSWETDAGEKRSAVEVQVDELGPSLKWATAKPEKANRPAAKGSGQFNDEPPF